MTNGRRFRIVSLLCALSGCAQSGQLHVPGTGMGTLKTSLSHLEFENQQLKREVAGLKAENRQIEDRLVQEEAQNGELTARLDDARSLLKGRGLDPSEVDPGPRTTLPAGQSSRKRRKPPFAQIPGRIDTVPPADDPVDESSPAWGTPGPRARAEFGPQSRLDRPALWLPIASGVTEPTTPRR